MEECCPGDGLPQGPIPAPPMFSGESPGTGDTASEESLYESLLQRLRSQGDEPWPAGPPRSQSYTEGSLQQAAEGAIPHAQSHHALLQDALPQQDNQDSHSCLHVLHTVVACQQEQIGVLQATLKDLAATYTRRERALLAKVATLQQKNSVVFVFSMNVIFRKCLNGPLTTARLNALISRQGVVGVEWQ
ncbi:hypothetical protein Pmani_016698 [Petrolisthes manimaculis]|uniref:Uncharacterized protein n=1 Tax=Petrolisthes manimaculis TaxID=1843537 RepID=A0AAE1U8H5_9EUCA|nr:hypothetical protein Pmani_016698 [Petrolisthes manimaculis]